MTDTRKWSASQVGKALDCFRWWAFDYIEKRRPPPKDSQRLGSAVHKHLELFLDDDVESITVALDIDQKAEAIARLMRPHLPSGRPLAVEKKRIRGNWLGYIDLEYEADPVGVSDHKTTSNIKKWAPTSAKLAEGVQGTIYAYLVAGVYGLDPGVDVHLWWTYGQTRPPYRAQAVRSSLLVGEAERRVAELDRRVVAPGNALHANSTPANEVEPNPSACGKYGGCPHRDICNLTTAQKLIGFGQKGNDMPTWKEIIENNPSPAQTPALAPAPPPGPATLFEKTGGAEQVGGPYPAVNRPAPVPASMPVSTSVQTPASMPVSTSVQTPASMPVSTSVPAPVPVPPEAEAESSPETGWGFELQIDCVITKSNDERVVVLVSSLVQKAHGKLCADFDLANYRSAPSGHPLEYGKAAGLLARYVMEDLDEYATSDMILQVSTRADETSLILGELEARAGRVIRGLR